MLVGLEQPTSGRITLGGRDRSIPSAERPNGAGVAARPRSSFRIRTAHSTPGRHPPRSIEEVLRLHFSLTVPCAQRGGGTRRPGRTGQPPDERAAADALRRPAPACRHRPRTGRGAEGALAGRSRRLPGRVDPGSDPQSAGGHQSSDRISYIVISHDLGVVRQITDSAIVMQRGVAVERGSTADVLHRPQHPYTQLLRRASPPPAGSRRAATGRGSRLTRARHSRLLPGRLPGFQIALSIWGGLGACLRCAPNARFRESAQATVSRTVSHLSPADQLVSADTAARRARGRDCSCPAATAPYPEVIVPADECAEAIPLRFDHVVARTGIRDPGAQAVGYDPRTITGESDDHKAHLSSGARWSLGRVALMGQSDEPPNGPRPRIQCAQTSDVTAGFTLVSTTSGPSRASSHLSTAVRSPFSSWRGPRAFRAPDRYRRNPCFGIGRGRRDCGSGSRRPRLRRRSRYR